MASSRIGRGGKGSLGLVRCGPRMMPNAKYGEHDSRKNGLFGLALEGTPFFAVDQSGAEYEGSGLLL